MFGVSTLLLSFMFVLTASANTHDISFDQSYATGPFLFYCNPYSETFVSGGHYTPESGSCAFSQPSGTNSGNGFKIIALYKGVPGNATLVAGDGVFTGATLASEDNVSFGTPAQDDNFFAAVWSYDQYGGTSNPLGQYLATGSEVPAGAVEGQNYFLLPWKWQAPPPPPDVCPLVNGDQSSGPCADTLCTPPTTWSVATQTCVEPPPVDVCPNVNGNQASGPCADTLCTPPATWSIPTQSCVAPPPADTNAPVITITNPLKYGIYERSDASVLLTATITDASPIVETTYWLNGKKIPVGVPLVFNSSTPLINKVMVAAKDAAGNRATSTLPFFVVKNKSNCLIDIVAILLALAQDKTLPDKPTLQNLIADCSCLNLGHHRWDWDNNNHH
jgi:hypothetical protein